MDALDAAIRRTPALRHQVDIQHNGGDIDLYLTPAGFAALEAAAARLGDEELLAEVAAAEVSYIVCVPYGLTRTLINALRRRRSPPPAPARTDNVLPFPRMRVRLPT